MTRLVMHISPKPRHTGQLSAPRQGGLPNMKIGTTCFHGVEKHRHGLQDMWSRLFKFSTWTKKMEDDMQAKNERVSFNLHHTERRADVEMVNLALPHGAVVLMRRWVSC